MAQMAINAHAEVIYYKKSGVNNPTFFVSVRNLIFIDIVPSPHFSYHRF